MQARHYVLATLRCHGYELLFVTIRDAWLLVVRYRWELKSRGWDVDCSNSEKSRWGFADILGSHYNLSVSHVISVRTRLGFAVHLRISFFSSS